ncbi:MAG: glycosyltransferase family 2 protein [Saprospiraceae bacterium]
MRVAGFTFIRNALQYDYPVVEAIRSILPLCDFFLVAVGRSEDNTLELVRSIDDPKLHIIETVWDDNLRAGGQVLAMETNKAFDAIPSEYDWCFYIQGDECVPESELPLIRAGMEKHLHHAPTEGLLLKYRHFYGSYDFVGASRRWYRREVRIIRNDKRIRSYRDAQGFRKNDGTKLRVQLLDAYIHHYGWVKNPATQQQKIFNFNKLWRKDLPLNPQEQAAYAYDGAEPLERFTGQHPAVMLPRIQAMNWQFAGDPTAERWGWKNRMSNWIEARTGWRPGEYRNYKTL